MQNLSCLWGSQYAVGGLEWLLDGLDGASRRVHLFKGPGVRTVDDVNPALTM